MRDHDKLQLDRPIAWENVLSVGTAIAALAACSGPEEDARELAARHEALAPCARATTFANVQDDGPRTSFRSTTDSTTLDWLTIGLSMSFLMQSLPMRMTALLEQLKQLDLGLPIDPLEHALQAATRAKRAGASDELVLAALCHSVGMTLTVENYGEVSAAMLRGFVSDDVYRVVRHHEEYMPARPSGAVDQRLRAHNAGQPWHAIAVRFADEWLAPAYDRSYVALELADFQPLLAAALSGVLPDPYATRLDCYRVELQP